jgi:hypothetical protein
MCVPANGGHLLSCRRSSSKFFVSWSSWAFPFHWLSHHGIWLILQRNLWHLVHVGPVIDDKYLLLSVSVLHQVWWDLMCKHLFHLKILVDYIVKSCSINSCSTLHLFNSRVSPPWWNQIRFAVWLVCMMLLGNQTYAFLCSFHATVEALCPDLTQCRTTWSISAPDNWLQACVSTIIWWCNGVLRPYCSMITHVML